MKFIFVEKKNNNYEMDLQMPRPRINGAMFPDFQSKNVTVLGVATEVMHVG